MLRNTIFTLATVAGLTGALAFTPKAAAQNFGVGYHNGNGTAVGIRIGGPSYYPPVYGYPSQSYYPPVVHDRQYHVYYRAGHSEPWRLYSTYDSQHRASRIEDYLEARGYNARIAHQ
jgi:hypothetical protein